MNENTKILYTILCGSTMSQMAEPLELGNSLCSLMVADSICPLPIELQCLHKSKYHVVLSPLFVPGSILAANSGRPAYDLQHWPATLDSPIPPGGPQTSPCHYKRLIDPRIGAAQTAVRLLTRPRKLKSIGDYSDVQHNEKVLCVF
jgi:hypothetical protein